MTSSDPPPPVSSRSNQVRIPRALWFVALALVAIALGASVILLVDSLKPAPVFCAAEGGCGAVKLSSYAKFHGIPTADIGLAGMSLLAILLLVDRPIPRSLFAAAAAGGALFAMNLIFQQWHMHAFCMYCMTFDTCMVLLAFVGLARIPSSNEVALASRATPFARRVGAIVLVAVALVPAVASQFLKARVPAPIEAELDATPADKWTLVDFVDFQCPYCRFTNADLAPILAKEAGKFRVVRKQVPLTRIHPHALSAAHAAVCADVQSADKGDQMAELLFTADTENLDDAHYREMAAKVGLDVDAFNRCLVDPATQSKIDDDVKTFVAVGGHGLPLLFIGRQRLEGGQEDATLNAAVLQAHADLKH